jgi:predicted enzyme involved in methoxymalonyl-ACP biosynthesis
MELAMFDALIEQCQARGVHTIVGVFIPSKKNKMVADHYLKLGFSAGEEGCENFQTWHYDVPQSQQRKAKYIHRATMASGSISDGASMRGPEAVLAKS